MKCRRRIWGCATAVVVVLLMLNPEYVELALLVDAIGLELFVLLIQVQMVVTIGAFVDKTMQAVRRMCICRRVHEFLGFSVDQLKMERGMLMLAVPGQATLIHLSVLAAAVVIAL